ncbi:MAG: Type restriction-modification system, specificity subunit [Ignavibacteria bacterium]|nr:Type restriction-modification system, specificity subunit [Ignavibacteria bacterium]
MRKIKHIQLNEISKFSNEKWNLKDFHKEIFPYIEISEIDLSNGDVRNIQLIKIEEAPSRARMIVKSNDIIISLTRPHRGAISLIDSSKNNFIASTGFAILREIDNQIIRKYLFIILRSQFCLTQMEQRSSGGNYPAITEDELKKILIPLPPLNIQNQIVGIMDNAYTEKKEKEKQAKELLDSIDDYVLGELGIKIPQVENKMCFSINSSEIEGRFDPFYYKIDFKVNREIISKGKYPVSPINEIKDEIIKGKLPNETEKIGNNKVIQINCINADGSIDLENLLTAKDIFQENQKLNQNDILIVITGATIGKVSIWNNKGDFFLGGDIVKIKSKEDVNSYYVYAFLRTNVAQTEIKRNITGATNGHLAPSDILKFIIPLPPLEIQNKIADEVKRRMDTARRLQKVAAETLEAAKLEVERIIFGV